MYEHVKYGGRILHQNLVQDKIYTIFHNLSISPKSPRIILG